MKSRRRKTHFSKQQWMVQRERFHIDEEAPVPTSDHTVRIDEPVKQILKSIGLNLDTTQHRLIEHWADITGPSLARHIRPGPMENGRLTVYCTNSVMLAELKRFQGKILLTNIQKAVGDQDVKRLMFQMDPDTRGIR